MNTDITPSVLGECSMKMNENQNQLCYQIDNLIQSENFTGARQSLCAIVNHYTRADKLIDLFDASHDAGDLVAARSVLKLVADPADCARLLRNIARVTHALEDFQKAWEATDETLIDDVREREEVMESFTEALMEELKEVRKLQKPQADG